MKILFLCPSLEAGRDGVGDYARRLGAGLQKHGHGCTLLAINDRLCQPSQEGLSEQIGIEVFRLCAEQPWSKRIRRAADFVAEHRPDWLSLQFVPYGYHRRGYCFGLGQRLSHLAPKVKRHVFFHELTTGIGANDRLVNRFHGVVQRLAIRQLRLFWPPDLVHTHLPLYQAYLARWGTKALIMPICGNIPIAPRGAVCPEFDSWSAVRAGGPDNYVFGGFFGCFYPSAANPELFAGLQNMAATRNLKIVLFLAGRQPAGALQRWHGLAASNFDRLRWVSLGELEPVAVSCYLQALDFGISATPWQLVGKSSGVAAMLDHGLPVLVPRNDFASGIPAPPYPSLPSNLINIMGTPNWRDGEWLKMKSQPNDSVVLLAHRFLADLSSNNRPLVS